MQKLARIISTIFIPPTLTLFSFIYLSLTFENNSVKQIYIIVISFVFGFILQIASFMYFYKRGLVSDVDAKIKKERTIPYFVSIIIFFIGFVFLLISNVQNISTAFWFCYISNTFLVFLINRYFKISIHAMGVSGPLALFTFTNGFNALFLMPVLAAVGWSRIKLMCHSPAEVIAGTLLGFMSVYFQLNILLAG